MEKKLLRKIGSSFLLAEAVLICIFSAFFYRHEINKKRRDAELVLNQFEAAYEKAEERQLKKRDMYAVDYLNRAGVIDYILGRNPELQSTEGLQELSRQMEIEMLFMLDQDGRILVSNIPEFTGAELLDNEGGRYIRRLISGDEQTDNRMVFVREAVFQGVPAKDFVAFASAQEEYRGVFIGIGEDVREGVEYAADVDNVLGSVPCNSGQALVVIDLKEGLVLGSTMPRLTDKQVKASTIEVLSSGGKLKKAELKGFRVLLQSRTFQDMLLVSAQEYDSVFLAVIMQVISFGVMLLLIFLVLIAVVKRYFHKYIFAEFQMIEDTVRDFLAGKEGTEFHTDQDLETRKMVETLNKLIRINNELKLMAKNSERDSVTGLLNRKGVERYMKNYMKLSDKRGIMLMMDMDNFKAVNDHMGHPEGDRVLQVVADCLKGVFHENNVIARLGGDEFAVFLNTFVPKERLAKMLDTMIMSLREKIADYYRDYHVSISIGAAVLTPDIADYQVLYQCADEALYEAKRSGKDRYVIRVCGEAKDSEEEEVQGGV